MKKTLFLILLLSFLIRLINLNQSLWLDEAISATTVEKYGAVQILTKFIEGDVHPPLYYLILDLWSSVFGFSEVSLRTPSIIFAVLTCLFVYKIGKKLTSEKISQIAALFFALNPLSVYYSQEVRMYSLTTLLVTLAIYGLVSKKNWLFIIGFTGALYTDYLPILMLPIFLVTNFKSAVISLLLFVPWLPVFFRQLSAGASLATSNPEWGNVVGGGNLKNLALTFIKFIFGRVTIDNKILYAAISFLVGLEYIFILIKAKRKLLWAWLLVPIVLGFLISLKIPIFGYHRFLFVVPAFCLLLAIGARRSVSRITFVTVISLLSIIFFNLNYSLHREDWRSAVTYIENNPGIVLMPSRAQASPIHYYSPSLIIQDKENFNPSSEKVYLVRYVQELFDPTDYLRTNLETNGYQKTEEKGFNGVLIWKYERVL